jgi:hypothetical protein
MSGAPEASDMAIETAIETYRGVVYPWQMDHMDHMNVQFYTARFDEATWHLFAALGMSTSYFKENRRGMAVPFPDDIVRRQRSLVASLAASA